MLCVCVCILRSSVFDQGSQVGRYELCLAILHDWKVLRNAILPLVSKLRVFGVLPHIRVAFC